MNATPKPLRVDLDDGMMHVLLDRPQRGNALDADTVESLLVLFDEAERQTLRGMVLRGSGRHFCTGFDLPEDGAASDGDLLLRFVRVEELLQRCYRAPFVTIAVAQGRTFGAGTDLFAACDRRIAIEGGSFCFPGAQFGLILGTGRLIRRTGLDMARHLIRTGQAITSGEALTCGLATHVATMDQIGTLVAGLLGSRLSTATTAALHRVEAAEGLVEDDAALAALVRSAAAPGLGQRIAAYRAVQRAAHAVA